MAFILHLESSTSVCSVALAKEGKRIDLLESNEGQNHARLLGVFARDLLIRNGIAASELDAVAVSEGPGSYTGLRIGVSLAKGLCFANRIPLIAISPLQAMSAQVIERSTELGLEDLAGTLLVPMLDARRMEVYTALFDHTNSPVRPVSSMVIDESSFLMDLSADKLLFFGNGADKCKPVITHPHAHFLPDIRTSAQFMCGLAWKAFQNKRFADLAYFEPFYLKDFIAGVPRKNIFNN